jgi:hypothetical protein
MQAAPLRCCDSCQTHGIIAFSITTASGYHNSQLLIRFNECVTQTNPELLQCAVQQKTPAHPTPMKAL